MTASRSKQKSYLDTTWWDPYVADITDTDTYLRRKFRQDVTDKTTGLGQVELAKRLAEIAEQGKAVGESWRITKAKCFAAQVREQSIDVSPFDWFPAIAVWNRLSLPIWAETKRKRAAEVNAKMLPEWVRKEWGGGQCRRRLEHVAGLRPLRPRLARHPEARLPGSEGAVGEVCREG